MIADGDPIANAMFDKYRQVRMPNLRIGDDDFAELIGFLEKQSKAPEGAVAGSKDSGGAPRADTLLKIRFYDVGYTPADF
jgi:hypothetical protein